tara:strand:- start:717 stop:1148 length:432 start_codon:yes stop_codon:yes gene_type:complete
MHQADNFQDVRLALSFTVQKTFNPATEEIIRGVVCRMTFQTPGISPQGLKAGREIAARGYKNPYETVFTEAAVCAEDDGFDFNVGAKIAFIRTVKAALPHKKACSPRERAIVRGDRSAVWNALKLTDYNIVVAKIPREHRRGQ